MASEPHVVAKAVLSNPLLSCVTTVAGEPKLVGEGPKTEVVFMTGTGDGLTG